MGNVFVENSRSPKVFLVKSIIALFVIFLGVGGGIYVGSAFSGKKIGSISPEDLPNSSLLEIGEIFPDYEFANLTSGEVFNISDFAKKNGRTILMIVSPTCEPCHVLADFWNKKIEPKIDDDVNVLLVFDSLETVISDSAEKPLVMQRAISVNTDRSEQAKSDRMQGTPTIVGLDAGCRIKFISSGFTQDLNARFINKFL